MDEEKINPEEEKQEKVNRIRRMKK